MGIISDIVDLIKLILQLFRGDWKPLKDEDVPNWVRKVAKKLYHKRNKPLGTKAHFIGRTFFYRVWYKGNKDWKFYRRIK